MRWIVILGLMALCGCTATGSVSGASSLATGLESTLDQAINQLIMQKLADSHNLQVGAQQILSATGMVVMVPAVGTTTPMMTTVPAMPVSQPTVASPTIPGAFPTGPVVTPP